MVFLDELAKTGNVSASCKKAKIVRSTAYLERETLKEFSAAWDAALEVATDALELEARRRAAEGVLEPVFYQGELVAKVKKYSDTLLIFLLKAHRPEKYRENIHQENTGPNGGPQEVILKVVRDSPRRTDDPSA